MDPPKKIWNIVGYDSTTKIYAQNVPLDSFTVRQMEAMLQLAGPRGTMLVPIDKWPNVGIQRPMEAVR